MKEAKKWYKNWWFKPTIIIIGILLIIIVINIKVNKPFEDFIKKIKQAAAPVESAYNMDEIITANDPYLGNKDANIQIVEFADFNCPYCKQSSSIIREILIEYEDQVFYQFRDFPVVTEQSIFLAMAGSCAHEQNKFWAFHDLLFQRQGEVNELNINQLAQGVGLNTSQFSGFLNSEKFKNEVLEDFLTGDKFQIKGTPTFFVNGSKFQGVPTKDNLKRIIDQLILLEEKP